MTKVDLGASADADRAATPSEPGPAVSRKAGIPSAAADMLKALEGFARAVDKAIVTDWASRPGHPFGERIAEIRCDSMMGDDEEKQRCRTIQKWRDRLVELGVLEAVR
jgi:hypothetical protein